MTGVFCQREDMAKKIANKTKTVDGHRGSRWLEGHTSGGATRGNLPEGLPPDQNGGYQAMLEQGLRLNRAFIAISDPRVREAIVNLVVEAGELGSGAEFRLLTERRTRTALRKPG
jgi:hypothetical protein